MTNDHISRQIARIAYAKARAAERTKPQPEVWTEEDLDLWQAATPAERRAAICWRMKFRASHHPETLVLPACPVANMLCRHELAYRAQSACKGGDDG